VPCHRACHLYAIAIFRGYEVRADQQENDIRTIDLLADAIIDVVASNKTPVMPSSYDTLALQHRQTCLADLSAFHLYASKKKIVQ